MGRAWALVAVTALLVVPMAGCRQPDGDFLSPAEGQANKNNDLARDLVNVANRSSGATGELRDDLANLTSRDVRAEHLQKLTTVLEEAVSGKQVSEENARPLAETLFLVIGAKDLSRKQIEALRADVTRTARQAVGDDAAAERIGTAAAELLHATSTNQKRWYHLF